MEKYDYKSAGVDINAANDAISRVKTNIHTTFNDNILSKIGGFAAMLDLHSLTTNYKHPVLVQSVDGIGTKAIIARLMQRYDTVGIDLLSATSNDILVVGAKPVTLLDYIACDKLEPDVIEEILNGLTETCKQHQVALIGGELAEMPDTYLPGEHDIVGIVSGIVEKDKIITGADIAVGDKILGLASNGLHTNGYSLARKVLFNHGYKFDSYVPEFNASVGEILLSPHLNYTHPVFLLLNNNINIKGMAHITGGGLVENIPRILPKTCAATIVKKTWPVLPEFKILKTLGEIADNEMYRTFNMGIGYVFVVAPDQVDKIHTLMTELAEFKLYDIGEITPGTQEVKIV